MIIASFIACEKQEVKPQKWYLDFAAPALSYHAENMPCNSIGTNIGADGRKVGLSLDFEDERFKTRIYTEDRNITQVTGRIDGKTFVVLDGKMNVCGGVQGIEISINLKFE